MVFFIPFSATVVVNFPSGESGSGLQVSMFFGTLWVTWEALKVVMTGQLRTIPHDNSLSVRLLLLFMVVVAASLLMPIIINGSLQVASPILLDTEMTPLTLTSHNITQTLYLAYGIIIAILVSITNQQKHQLRTSIKIYILSGVFVSLWGLLQWSLYQFDIPYPDFIFNNSINPSALGYRGVFDDINLKRISSVAVEPSILAQFLLTSTPFVFFAVGFRIPIFSLVIDKAVLVLFLIVLVLSTAFSAYLGLALLLCSVGLVTLIMQKFRRQFALILMGAAVLAVSAYLLSPFVGTYLNEIIIQKGKSYSALERFSAAMNAWGYFLKYPVLGIGWGSATSHDLFIGLLATTGIVGFVVFVFFAFYLFNRLFKALKVYRTAQEVDEDASTLSAVTVSFITLLSLNAFTGFAYVFGHFWFIIGLAMAVPSIVLRQKRASLEKAVLPRGLV
jgi:O-antigen ligase